MQITAKEFAKLLNKLGDKKVFFCTTDQRECGIQLVNINIDDDGDVEIELDYESPEWSI